MEPRDVCIPTNIYLDEFVRRVGGVMHIEVQTGRGRMDLLITHNQRKYIVETKIWRGESRYQSGKKQLAAYLKSPTSQNRVYQLPTADHQPLKT